MSRPVTSGAGGGPPVKPWRRVLRMALRAIAGGPPAAVVWAFPRPVAWLVLAVMSILSAAHPWLVVYRTWASLRGASGGLARMRAAAHPADPYGRTILSFGIPCTVLILCLLPVYDRTVGPAGGIASLLISGLFLVSFVHGSGMARESGSRWYQLRATFIGGEIADLAQKTITRIVKNPVRAESVMEEWFGRTRTTSATAVTAGRSPGQALLVLAVAVLGAITGTAGAMVGEVRGDVVVPKKDPVETSTTAVAATPAPALSGPVPTPAPAPGPVLAVDVCGADPYEVLSALLGPSRRDLTDAATAVLGPLGYDVTGCPGGELLRVGALTVIPLRAVLGRPSSYVVLDDKGRASVVGPEAFSVFGRPDPTVSGGFTGGALTAPSVVRIEGPYANAAIPGENTPVEQRDDRKAYLYVLHLADGSCSAALRTEPQKQFVLLPASVSAIAGAFAVEHGFILVTPVGVMFRVEAYDADTGFVDDLTISYGRHIAEVPGVGGKVESADDGQPCGLGTMQETRYPVA